MATISLAVAASHTPGLTGWFDKAPQSDRDTVQRAYDAIHDEVAAADLDALLIIGNDHVANTRVSEPWDFSFGLADRHPGPDEWFKPWLRVADYDLRGAPEIAKTLFESVRECGPNVRGVRENFRFDDNVSVPVTMAGLTSLDIPIIPILQNCTVPPVPDECVCYDFGKALGRAIVEDLPADARIGLLGSGGLSHEPGGPRYLEIDEKFDRWYMDLLVQGDHDRILAEATFERMEEAGSGGTAELLSWTVVMGAIGPRPCTDLGYVAVDQWRCGVGAVRWDV
ncbi:DODA-type extradiol aromatic ring-opening family dioxygenase [Nocardia sp. NPDC001965]